MTAPSGTPGALPIVCRQETLWLLPERALYWPAQRALMVADVHIGKAASFRALGQPVPTGTTQRNLDRLDALISTWRPASVVVLGDLIHDRIARRAPAMAALNDFRERHASLQWLVVAGNHDRRAVARESALRVEWVDEPYAWGPFDLRHHADLEPRASAASGARYALAGHVHPAVTLRAGRRDKLRLPCFVFDRHGAILPAFGEFTGHASVTAHRGRSIYVIGSDRVWPAPGTRRQSLQDDAQHPDTKPTGVGFN